MSGTQHIRASDRDREQVVTRLRGAVGDGRLTMDEYMERMEHAYQAVTYGDLAALYADLPAGAPIAEVPRIGEQEPAPLAVTPRARASWRGALAGLPCVLKVLWGIWLTAVLINVVVWVLVTATTGHLAYPWPLWVAGPYGAALLAMSAAVILFRGTRKVPPRLPAFPRKR